MRTIINGHNGIDVLEGNVCELSQCVVVFHSKGRKCRTKVIIMIDCLLLVIDECFKYIFTKWRLFETSLQRAGLDQMLAMDTIPQVSTLVLFIVSLNFSP